MTFQEAMEVLSKIKYKRAIFDLRVQRATDEATLIIALPVPCIKTGRITKLFDYSSIWRLEELTEQTLVNYVFDRCKSLESHEVGEWFKFRGKRLYDPHKEQPNYIPFDDIVSFPKFENEGPPKLELRESPYGHSPLYDMFNVKYKDFAPHAFGSDIKASQLVDSAPKVNVFVRLWRKVFK